MNTYWISFASEQEFCGVVIVQAADEAAALEQTILSGTNPGPHTSVEMSRIRTIPPAKFMNRRLNAEEANALVIAMADANDQ